VLSAEQSARAMETPPTASAADILASRNDEIARLTARINAQTQASQSRARRKAISTSTREYRYASYMEAWRRKVERIGNLNYPAEAREQGLSGNLILHVAVRADGSLEGVRVVRSSGQEVLDQAAVRIVELAAPFAEFPADIAAETDVLDITRTWQFQRNNRLGWDH
jgi:protein TonB